MISTCCGGRGLSFASCSFDVSVETTMIASTGGDTGETLRQSGRRYPRPVTLDDDTVEFELMGEDTVDAGLWNYAMTSGGETLKMFVSTRRL